jgi:hypothetical protein
MNGLIRNPKIIIGHRAVRVESVFESSADACRVAGCGCPDTSVCYRINNIIISPAVASG